MIKYRKRRKYKYILYEDYSYDTMIKVSKFYQSQFLDIDTVGHLLIKAGYSWDGATGFPDLITIMRGSLVHDALYQLMREGVLLPSDRDAADRIIEKICIDAGMSKWLAGKVYKAVMSFGENAANSKIMTAP